MNKKTENIKMGFGALGCALKFRKNLIKRSDGTYEYYVFLRTLARNESISKIVLLQRSDWKKLNDAEKIEFDPRGVIFDPYSDYDDFNNSSVSPDKHEDTQLSLKYKNLWEKLKSEEPLDFIINFIGMGYCTNNSIPNFLGVARESARKFEGQKTRLQWVTCNYCAPLVHYINMSKTPWYMIACDPRYIKKNMRMRDTFWAPREVIAQYDQDLVWDSVETYEGTEGTYDKEIAKPVKMLATGIEKLARIGNEIISPDNDRPIKLTMVAMQSQYGNNPDLKDERLEMLKKWIFKYDKDEKVHVYGKWDSEIIKGYEKRFKGYIHYSEVDNIMSQTRYTLIKGIRGGWATGKWADVLACGCVPFMTDDYDTCYSIVPKDHFVRCKNPEDLYKKIEYLEANPDKRIALVKKMQIELLKNARSGVFLYELLNKSFERTGLPIELSLNKDESILRKTKSINLF